MSDVAKSSGDAGLRGGQRSPWMRFLGRTNLVVTGLTACVVLYSRSAAVAYFSAGAVACSITVKLLKRVLRQPRPQLIVAGKRKKSYGMPSTHSATITFFATYIPLACAYLPMHHNFEPFSPFIRWVAPLVAIPWAVMVMVSRISLGHHTWPQVAVGSAYGATFASAWFQLWIGGLDAYGRGLEQSALAYLRHS